MTDHSQNKFLLIQALLNQIVLARASELARDGNYREAEEFLQEVMQNREASADFLDLFARVHAQQKHWQKAKEAWEQALQINPNNKSYIAGLKCISRIQQQSKYMVITLLFFGILLVSLYCLTSRNLSILIRNPPTEVLESEVSTSIAFKTKYALSDIPQIHFSSPTLTQPITPLLTLTLTPHESPPIKNLTISPTSTLFSCKVTTGISNGTLNVRRGPDVFFPVIGLLNENDQVLILSDPEIQKVIGWIMIIHKPDLKGWINLSYCK